MRFTMFIQLGHSYPASDEEEQRDEDARIHLLTRNPLKYLNNMAQLQ